jgi:hypothetical protein
VIAARAINNDPMQCRLTYFEHRKRVIENTRNRIQQLQLPLGYRRFRSVAEFVYLNDGEECRHSNEL